MGISIARVAIVLIVLVLRSSAPGQASAGPPEVNFCDMVRSPALYNGRLVVTSATLFPGYHSLSLHRNECESTSKSDVRTQAVLPPDLKSLPDGKKLKSILNHGRSADVEVTGLFESQAGRYGPDVAPFRFTITRLNSVAEAHQH